MNAAYATPYSPSYAAAPPQYGLVPVNQYPYPLVQTGQIPAPVVPAAPARPAITSAAYWTETVPSLGVPKWTLPAATIALLSIGYAWHTGMFGGKSAPASRRARSSRDASSSGSRSGGSRSGGSSRSGSRSGGGRGSRGSFGGFGGGGRSRGF
jgi:hypothetical protein